MPPVTPELRERLAKLLGMCGSAHDGERAAAAKAADDLVRRSGLTWFDVFGAKAPEWVDPFTLEAKLGAIWAWRSLLTDWELEFIESVLGRPRLSDKQIAIVDKLVDRARAFVKAGGQ